MLFLKFYQYMNLSNINIDYVNVNVNIQCCDDRKTNSGIAVAISNLAQALAKCD